MALTIGDKIPDLLGKDETGRLVKSSDFSGKKLVLYFYPKDNTPGCTAEACSLRDGYSDLLKAGYAVVGVSVDSEKSHQRFKEKKSLPFPLIADIEKELVETFGVWQKKKLAGVEYMGIVRTTYLIEENGVIQHIFTGKEVNTKDHANQILAVDQ